MRDVGKATELRVGENVEVKESDSKVMPGLQYKRKDDLAYQHIKFQESGHFARVVQQRGHPRGQPEANRGRVWGGAELSGSSSGKF